MRTDSIGIGVTPSKEHCTKRSSGVCIANSNAQTPSYMPPNFFYAKQPWAMCVFSTYARLEVRVASAGTTSRRYYLTLAQELRVGRSTHLRTSRYSNWQVDSTNR